MFKFVLKKEVKLCIFFIILTVICAKLDTQWSKISYPFNINDWSFIDYIANIRLL